MFILWKQPYLALLLRRSNTRGKNKNLETKEFLKDTRQVVSRSKVHALPRALQQLKNLVNGFCTN